MKRSFYLWCAGLVLVLSGTLLLVVSPVEAGGAAAVTVDAAGISVTPGVYYSKAVLTVSGGQQLFQLEFDAHQTPVLGFFDAEGQVLPDGTYTWELKLMPDAVAARSLREAAKANDGSVPSAWAPQSGAFTIRNGAIARPDLVESGQARAVTKGAPRKSAATRAPARSYGDSDSAVASGLAIQSRGAAANGAPAAARSARPAAADSDRATAAAGGSLDRNAAPKTTATLVTAKPTPAADGSDGRSKTTPKR